MSRALALVESNTTGTGRLLARRAREQGMEPILLAADVARYPFAREDAVATVETDTGELGAVLDAVDRLGRDGTAVVGITSSSDYFVATAAAAARRLGRPGPAPDAVHDCQDKALQVRRLRAAAVSSPASAVVETIGQAASAAAALGLPVVVKPVMGSGSVNVTLCRSCAEVREAAERALTGFNERAMRIPRRALVQSYVQGPEFSLETFGGRLIGVTRKHVGSPPHFVETGHDFPADLPGTLAARVGAAALAAVRALGLDWGPAHVELRLAAGSPCIIEVNPRLAGGFIPELVRLASGIDLVAEMVRTASGSQPCLTPTCRRFAAIRFLLASAAGRVFHRASTSGAAAAPGVADLRLYCENGAEVRPSGDFRDRIGHAIAVADVPGKAAATAEQALVALRETVELEAELRQR